MARKKSIPPKTAKAPPVVAEAISAPAKALRFPYVPPWVWMLFIALVVVGLRWVLIDFPLERDESAYAYLGKQAWSGKLPYRDYYEMKPPLLYYAYGFFNAVFGYSHRGMHLALMAISIWNAVWLFVIGRMWGNQTLGLVAAVVYAVLSAHPYMSGLNNKAEHMVIALLLPAVWMTEQALQKDNIKLLLGSSVLLGALPMIKQTALVFSAGGLLWVALWFLRQEHRKGLLKNAGLFITGLLIPGLLTLLFLWAMGVGEEARFWLWEYPRTYTSSVSEEDGRTMLSFSFKRITGDYEVYFLVAVLGLLGLWLSKLKWQAKGVITALLLLAIPTIFPGRRFYGHYWLLLLPGLALLFGAAFYMLQNWISNSSKNSIATILVTAAGITIALYHPMTHARQYWSPDIDQLVEYAFPGNPFNIHRKLADIAKPLMQEGDEFAVFGSEPEYYVYLNRNSPTRHFYTSMTSRPSPYSKGWQEEAWQDILKKKPKYVVFCHHPFSWMMKPDSDRILLDKTYYMVYTDYQPIAFAEVSGNAPYRIISGQEALTFKPSTDKYFGLYVRK